MARSIEIVRAVGVALDEDAGRAGLLRHAIPRGGALDPEGLALANAAVGNELGAAGIGVQGSREADRTRGRSAGRGEQVPCRMGSLRSRAASQLALSLIVLGGVSHDGRVQAQCGCSCPAEGAPFLRGGHSLPTNARIFGRLGRYDAASVSLVTDAGTAVAFTLVPAGDGRGTAFWLLPDAPLVPGNYILSAHPLPGTSASEFSRHVVVDATVDTTPPPFTSLRFGAEHPALCHPVVGATVGWDAPNPPSSDVLLDEFVTEVEITLAGGVVRTTFPEQVAFNGTTAFGTSDAPSCFGASEVQGLAAGSPVTGRVRIWDMAGNSTPFAPFELVPERLTVASVATCPRPDCAVSAPGTGRHRPVSTARLLPLFALALALSRRQGCRIV